MVGRSRYWFQLLLVWVIAITALPRYAAAQTTTSSATLTMSTTNPVTRVNNRPGGPGSNSTDVTIARTITRADCSYDKLKFRFALTVVGYQTGWDLVAYAGRGTSNCANEIGSSAVTRTCWQLGSKTIPVVNGVATAEFTAAELLGIGQSPSTALRILNSCDDTSNTGRGRQSFTVYFILVFSSVVQGSTTQGMYYSLTGPDAPTISQVNAADTALQLTWNSIAQTLTTDVTYEFYCAPNEGGDAECRSSALESVGSKPASNSTSGAGGTTSTEVYGGAAGTTTAAGEAGTYSGGAAGEAGVASDAGSPITEQAGEAGQTTGASSTALQKLWCGSVRGKINTSGYTDTILKNDRSYAVTVGVRDTYGNLGTLAPHRCGTPVQIDTFFEKYRESGGKAGGGFCNLGVHATRGALSASLVALGLLAWVRRRRSDRQQLRSHLSHHRGS